MALPFLIKHIYSNGTEENIISGKKAFLKGYIEIVHYNELNNAIHFKVKDERYYTYYIVKINKYNNQQDMDIRCTCTYNITSICRHKATALFYLHNLLEKNELKIKYSEHDTMHTNINIEELNLNLIKQYCSPKTFYLAEEILKKNRPHILSEFDDTVNAEFIYNEETFNLKIKRVENKNYATSCNCRSEKNHPLCLHKVILLMQLYYNYGINYFDSIKNWDIEKNKLLSKYGYTLKDNLKNKFEFAYVNGKPFLKILDKTIVQKELNINTKEEIKTDTFQPLKMVKKEIIPTVKDIGLVFQFNTNEMPFFKIDLVEGEINEEGSFISKVKKIDANFAHNYVDFNEESKRIIHLLKKFNKSELSKFVFKNDPFQNILENSEKNDFSDYSHETVALIYEYFFPKLKMLHQFFFNKKTVSVLPNNKMFITQNLQFVTFNKDVLDAHFKVEYINKKYKITPYTVIGKKKIELIKNESANLFLFVYNNQIYCWKDLQTILDLFKYTNQEVWIENQDWSNYFNSTIYELSKKYTIDFVKIIREKNNQIIPIFNVLVKELGEYLIFEPKIKYNDRVVELNNHTESILECDKNKIIELVRDKEVENSTIQYIFSLHPHFIKKADGNFVSLKINEVIKDGWFYKFIEKMKEKNIEISMEESVQNYRLNTSKPTTKINIVSNINWFDATVNISFGEQQVTVNEIKKMIEANKQYIQLQDGTIGIVPEEWIKKYSLLFKMGKTNNAQSLQINKIYFNIIDDLYNQRNEEELNFELNEKFELLKKQYEIKEIKPNTSLSKLFRPYQLSGFQWLNYLTEVKCGGILADDMGLGKTIQSLSILQHFLHEKQSLKAMVICPNTLLSNWKNEIEKFTPNLTYYIHHGTNRKIPNNKNNNYHIFLTSYGTIRSDITYFMEQKFDYVVLDESQIIKNPLSKISKAVCLLKAEHRLCLSGTPLQNNTYDLFAQMNFLNPNLLGNLEFFKKEFALPIDKYNSVDHKNNLKKIVYPFILRRTKEMVAKDLPPKLESIIYCDMGEEQRNIYEMYRLIYKKQILGQIENVGIKNAQLSILQGLMKLRQICDSPSILNEVDKYKAISIKTEELMSRLKENILNHKVLIFSQFLGMLALIKENLDKEKISYVYMDGQNNMNERTQSIQKFQNEEECKIFLISLKTGGLGINLTAADYVYIIDPWWNPAVEQQAIDRTHRIGQTKNVFAFKMICTDTVEDKIIVLQDRKKKLIKDIISDENSFVKTLNKEDIEFLFS